MSEGKAKREKEGRQVNMLHSRNVKEGLSQTNDSVLASSGTLWPCKAGLSKLGRAI